MRLVLALALTTVTAFLTVLCLVILFEMIWQSLAGEGMLNGKDTVFVPLVFLTTYFLIKWTREAWAKWKQLRGTAG